MLTLNLYSIYLIMTTTQLSFNPNATLFMTNSLLFQKPIKHHSRNTSKTKKPELSKLSMLTKASVCSTKGTNLIYFHEFQKQKNQRKNRNRSMIQHFLSKSLDESNKQNLNATFNHSSSLGKKLSELHADKDRTVQRKRANGNSSLQMERRTKRNASKSTQNKSNPKTSNKSKKDHEKQNKSKQKNEKKLSNFDGKKNKKKKSFCKNRKSKIELSLESIHRLVQQKGQNEVSKQKIIENDQQNKHFASQPPYMLIMSQTNKKKCSIQNQLYSVNEPLYSSVFINKSPNMIKEEAKYRQNFYLYYAQSNSIFDSDHNQLKNNKNQSLASDKCCEHSQRQNILIKTEKILNNYKQQCRQLKKQRDHYRSKFYRAINQLKNGSFFSNSGNLVVNQSKIKGKR